MSKRKANFGYTRKRHELLFFFPNYRRRQLRIKCGLAKATDVRKVAFKKYLQTSLFDENRSL
jgi:hypothetical protein